MKKTCAYLFILICLTILLTGCVKNNPEPMVVTPTTTISRDDSRVEIFQIIDTPFTADSPTRQIGYAGVYRPHLLLTAKHLIPEEIGRLVIKNKSWKICPLKQLRIHPLADIAMIETSIPCADWSQEIFAQNSLPKEVIYLDGNLKKTPVRRSFEQYSALVDEEFRPGMSGSPLFLADHTIIWIVTAHTASWTEFIPLTPALLASRPAITAYVQ
jgi:hypothetical protein